MPWLPLVGLLMGTLVAFDAYRAFATDTLWGRPWPRADRDQNATLFWSLQLARIVSAVGLTAISTLWLLAGA